jgi:pimeloyl-ACP methyl ester carboxylesterase
LLFTQTGTQTLQFKVYYQDASWAATTSQVEVIANNTAMRSIGDPCFKPQPINTSISEKANIQADISFADYEGRNFKGMGEVAYYYATSKGCDGEKPITKPIIIIDGFDPQDDRSVEEIYSRRLLYNGEADNLGKNLRDLGYDVIILNFPIYNVGSLAVDGGADYIERNAFTLVKLIQQTNAQLQANGSSEQLVVVGPSMGGLISRYALAYMEKHNIPHNTRLWVSFDSPHNGANISIGAQEFLRYWGGQGSADAQEAYDIKINSRAAKQMLLWHRNVGNFPRTPQAHWYRNTFNQNLNNNGILNSGGFPMNLRKIALVNGSISGQLSGVAGEKNLQMDLWMRVLTGNLIKVGDSWINNTGSYGNQQQAIYCWKIRATRVDEPAAPSNSISYDIAPGGTFNTYEIIRNLGQKDIQVNGVWIRPLYSLNKTSHSFIPTKSALAFKGTNQDLGESINNRDLVCTGETPFEAYYAPNENQEHATLHQEGVTWFLQQIAPPNKIILCKNTQNLTLTTCPANTSGVLVKSSFNISIGSYNNGSVNISGRSTGEGFVEFWKDNTRLQRYDVLVVAPSVSDISGPASVCSGAATFTLNNIPTGVGVTWATSPNLSPTSGSGTVATVSAVGSGEAWIEYTISACGQKIRRYINTLNYTQLEGSRYVCAGGSNLYSVDNFEGATYTWQSSPNITLTQISPNVVSANGISDGNGFVRVTISVNNACHSQTRTLNRNVWVGLPTAPIVTQPAGSTPIAPNTYSFTYQKLDLPAVPSTHAIRFASAGAERIVYTVDNLLVRPSLFADLPEGWGILSGTNNNTLSIDTKRMDIGTYTYTIMGQNDCNNNPFADTAPKTTVIVNIVGLDPLRSVQGNVQIYPNPVEDVLHLILESKQEQAVRYELYNPYSQKVASGSFDERCSIDVSKLPKNVYFLHLHYPDGSTEKRQIVVQK